MAAKNELLFQYDINYNGLPSWQKRGVGLSYDAVIKTGINPKNDEEITFSRKEVILHNELPVRDAYRKFLLKII